MWDVFKNRQFSSFAEMGKGIDISYISGFTEHIDMNFSIAGSFLNNNYNLYKGNLLLELNATSNFKLFTDIHFANPYVTGGVGFSKLGIDYDGHLSLGPGLQFNIGKGSFLFLSSQYKFAFAGSIKDRLNLAIGFGGHILRKKRLIRPAATSKLPVETVKEIDSDGDGIKDFEDSCRTIKGVLKYNGCPVPDTDKDGLNDEVDKCPYDSGSLKYLGCKVPDSDSDGLNDEVDNCPYVPGVVKYKGCPIPDTDGDGINDESDSCINVKGAASNFGCPLKDINNEEKKELDKLANRIYFASGSSKLLDKSFEALNQVAGILKQNSKIILSD